MLGDDGKYYQDLGNGIALVYEPPKELCTIITSDSQLAVELGAKVRQFYHPLQVQAEETTNGFGQVLMGIYPVLEKGEENV